MNAGTKFVVWDWNGTLLDDTDIVLDCINIILIKLQCPPASMELLRNTQARSIKDFYFAIGVPKEKIEFALAHDRNTFHDNYESRADNAPLRKGASSLLQRLKANNIPNFIQSNHITDQIVRLLKRHDIQKFFDKVSGYASREVQFCGMTKGERLRSHINDEGLNASNALIVGDTCEEIEIAHELGMCSVAITGGILSEDRLRATKPDHVVHSLDDLNPILQQRGFIR